MTRRRRLLGQGAAEVVDAEPLATHLRAWVTRWLNERPKNTHGIGGSVGGGGTGGQSLEETFMGPIDWLAHETGLNLRRVSGICNGEFSQVPLAQADALLIAIGENYRLDPEHNDVIVRRNRNWSPEQWLAYMEERGCT